MAWTAVRRSRSCLFLMAAVSLVSAAYIYTHPSRFMRPEYPERVRRWIPIIYASQPGIAGVAFLAVGFLFLFEIL